jgi:hypothetical protein
MHLRFTLRVLFSGTNWRKVRHVNGLEDRSLESIDEVKNPGAFMYGPIQEQTRSQSKFPNSGALARINFRKASTAEVRAYLSELKTLPCTQRRLLCRLLKRAAALGTPKVSVVPLADAHQRMMP